MAITTTEVTRITELGELKEPLRILKPAFLDIESAYTRKHFALSEGYINVAKDKDTGDQLRSIPATTTDARKNEVSGDFPLNDTNIYKLGKALGLNLSMWKGAEFDAVARPGNRPATTEEKAQGKKGLEVLGWDVIPESITPAPN